MTKVVIVNQKKSSLFDFSNSLIGITDDEVLEKTDIRFISTRENTVVSHDIAKRFVKSLMVDKCVIRDCDEDPVGRQSICVYVSLMNRRVTK